LKKVIIVVLPKPRMTLVDYITLGGYRPILLFSIIRKVFKAIVIKRIMEVVKTYSILLEE
jgi:hypothetical protein